MTQYLQDYDDCYVFLSQNWTQAIQPYIKSTQIFDCPSRGRDQNGNLVAAYPAASSYGMNVGDGGYGGGPASREPGDFFGGWPVPSFSLLKASQVAVPATTIWISDGTGNVNLGYWNHSYVGAGEIEGGAVTNSIDVPYFGTRGQGTACFWPAFHLETSNMLFCDGHVKAEKLDILFKGNSVAPLTVADD